MHAQHTMGPSMIDITRTFLIILALPVTEITQDISYTGFLAGIVLCSSGPPKGTFL